MRTLSAFALAMALATGAAMAQGTGGSGGGGTEPGTSGVNTGKDAAATPTAAQCAKGWDSSLNISQAEFNMKCKKN